MYSTCFQHVVQTGNSDTFCGAYKLRRLHVLPHVFLTPTATIRVPCVLYKLVPLYEFQQDLAAQTQTRYIDASPRKVT